jgi:hypothetical protein
MRNVIRPIAVVVSLIVTGALLVTGGPASASASVERAQRRLNALGCDSGPVDGVLGEWTRSAVVRFQSRHRQAQSGELTRATTKVLFSATAKRCDVRPVPARSGQGRRIVISQRQNWLWLVTAQGKVTAQGGLIDNSSVLAPGRYATGSYCGRAARIHRNATPDGRLYLDNFVRFAPCGVGFHRIPRSVSTGVQIHPDWLLGTNYRESHGCIRLSSALSERVWSFTGARTKVRVI